MIPRLPLDAVREAIATSDWDRAQQLLDVHDADVRAAIDPVTGIALDDAPAWKAELDTQTALLLEMAAAREDARKELARLQRDQRGARAYLDAGRP